MPTLLAAVAVALGAAVQSVTGFGFSLVCAPFLIAAYRAPDGVQLNLVLALVVNLAMLTREHRGIDYRAAGLLLVPAVATTVPVAYAARHSQPGPLTVLAGVVCLGAVAALAWGRVLRGISGRAGTVVLGALSGGMNVIAGISGPAVAVFAVNAGWPSERSRPTMQVVFLGINVVSLMSLGWPDRLPAGLFVGFAAGVLAGGVLAGRLPGSFVRAATLAVAGAGSVLAIARGLA